MIDSTAISYDQIKADLTTYINSLPSETRWQDMLQSAAGITIIELLAGFGAFLTYKILMGQREASIVSAQLRSSVLGYAETLGYSAGRGTPAIINFSITTTARTAFRRLDVIGIYDNTYDLVCAESKVIEASTPTNLQVYIGNKITSSQIITTTAASTFRFSDNKISDAISVYLNGVESSCPSSYIDLLTDSFVLLTNPVGGVDLFSMNNIAPIYAVGDTLAITYVEWVDLLAIDNAKLVLDANTGTVSSFVPAVSPEALSHIRIAAPIAHETLSLVKGRDDYLKLARTFLPTALDVNAADVSAAVVSLTYLKEDLTPPSEIEEANLLASLDNCRLFGVPLPTLVDAIQVSYLIGVSIRLADINTLASQVNLDVAEILATYAKSFEVVISTYQIESELEALSYIQTARITFNAPVSEVFTASDATDELTLVGTWQAGTPIRVSSTGTLPAPLIEGLTYYVIAGTGTSRHLATTPGGNPIDITTAGTGTHTITRYEEAQLGWNEFAVITYSLTIIS